MMRWDQKQRKTYTHGTITKVRDYVAGMEYSRVSTSTSILDRIGTGEGNLLNSNDTYVYHYNLTDHLGNIRSVIRKGASDTAIVVVQKQDYYPFGKTKSLLAGGNNRYL